MGRCCLKPLDSAKIFLLVIFCCICCKPKAKDSHQSLDKPQENMPSIQWMRDLLNQPEKNGVVCQAAKLLYPPTSTLLDGATLKVASLTVTPVAKERALSLTVVASTDNLPTEYQGLKSIIPVFKICDENTQCIGGDSSDLASMLPLWQGNIPIPSTLGNTLVVTMRLCVQPNRTAAGKSSCGSWSSANSSLTIPSVKDPFYANASYVAADKLLQQIWENDLHLMGDINTVTRLAAQVIPYIDSQLTKQPASSDRSSQLNVSKILATNMMDANYFLLGYLITASAETDQDTAGDPPICGIDNSQNALLHQEGIDSNVSLGLAVSATNSSKGTPLITRIMSAINKQKKLPGTRVLTVASKVGSEKVVMQLETNLPLPINPGIEEPKEEYETMSERGAPINAPGPKVSMTPTEMKLVLDKLTDPTETRRMGSFLQLYPQKVVEDALAEVRSEKIVRPIQQLPSAEFFSMQSMPSRPMEIKAAVEIRLAAPSYSSDSSDSAADDLLGQFLQNLDMLESKRKKALAIHTQLLTQWQTLTP